MYFAIKKVFAFFVSFAFLSFAYFEYLEYFLEACLRVSTLSLAKYAKDKYSKFY